MIFRLVTVSTLPGTCSGEPPGDLIGYVRDGDPALAPDLQGTGKRAASLERAV